MGEPPPTPPAPGPRSRWADEAGGRSATYDERWEAMAAEGLDVHGEAGLVCRLAPRPATVLDAGCGTGRVALELACRGHDVTGVDLDASMLAVARAKSPAPPAPSPAWVHADLVGVDLGRTFEVVVAAGNVMIFLAPGTEAAVVANLARHLAPGGVLVAGFQLEADRLGLAAYDEAATAAGLDLAQRLATWEGAPYRGGAYAVSVHRRPPAD